ncbi:hypothetical protein Sliba_56630 [Streptomyces nigrescens]|uniref:Uncharacterized protein n=1 Tax=Streptomyces nigrescens TaxID=1920 RepID=A0A640TPY0_STRNI|nr:hypothetical protein Sliba_56630 [Streptomyces libani subsp. libani]GGW06267.1 hypothetical protein GCM10010500_72410 [Streptomyces libani subsp. libani]
MPYIRFRPEAGPSTKTAQHRPISTFVIRENTAVKDRVVGGRRGRRPDERGERGEGAGAVMK